MNTLTFLTRPIIAGCVVGFLLGFIFFEHGKAIHLAYWSLSFFLSFNFYHCCKAYLKPKNHLLQTAVIGIAVLIGVNTLMLCGLSVAGVPMPNINAEMHLEVSLLFIFIIGLMRWIHLWSADNEKQ